MPSNRKQINIRVSDKTRAMLEELCKVTDLTQSGAVTQGLRLLAKREGVVTDKAKKPRPPLDE